MSSSSKTTNSESVQTLVNAVVEKASSSLKMFAIGFADGRGLILTAQQDEDEFSINAELVSNEDLPELEEAVCTVDWSWIENSSIESIDAKSNMVRFKLNPAGPLVIGLGAWEGKPFLSFQPFKPAKK